VHSGQVVSSDERPVDAVGPPTLPDSDVDLQARVLDALGHAVICTDAWGVVTYWNRKAKELYGWTATEAVGRPIASLTVAPVGQDLAAQIMAALAEGRAWTGAFSVQRKDGSNFTALVTDSGLYDEKGELEAVIGVSTNLDEAVRPFVAQSSEAAVVTSTDGVVYYASPAVEAVFGWDDGDLVGRSLSDFVHRADRSLLTTSMAAAVEHAEPHVVELRMHRRDDSLLWVEVRVANLLEEPGVRGLVCTLRDIEERHAILERLEEMAHQDVLTGLPNRAVILERLEHAIARREKTGALLFLDLDYFKQINDTHGHALGDRLLIVVADRLRHAVRPEDTAGRWAGDEFVVLSETVGSVQEAAGLAARLADVLGRPVELGGVLLEPSASIGMAMLGDLGTADEVLIAADRDMYRIKRERGLEGPTGPP
jgi:diguanylate cyclase (GGDEF)-like protein/PAS domain S-box-containing protein